MPSISGGLATNYVGLKWLITLQVKGIDVFYGSLLQGNSFIYVLDKFDTIELKIFVVLNHKI